MISEVVSSLLSVVFCRTEHNIPIIILSDEDDDEGDFLRSHNDSSVLIVETERNDAGDLRYICILT